MSGDVVYRRFEEDDREPTYQMFRESIFDYVIRIGIIAPDGEDDVAGAWTRQSKLMLHLERTADEDWVADRDGRILGWARTIVRDGHAQLTHFFVSPDAQGQGVGRGLIERAFPPGLGPGRSILATQNPLALSLYLRHGVSPQGFTFTFEGSPQQRESTSDLEVQPAVPGPEVVAKIVAIEKQILGFDRTPEIEFFVDDRPAHLLHRGEEAVGYVFGSDGVYVGPGATLDPVDFPEVLRVAESSAAQAGQEHIIMTFPAAAASGVTWALESGYQIDPFYEVLLTNTPNMKLDRFLMTEPSFIW